MTEQLLDQKTKEATIWLKRKALQKGEDVEVISIEAKEYTRKDGSTTEMNVVEFSNGVTLGVTKNRFFGLKNQ